MQKQFKKALVAAAVIGAVASGISGTASAYVYGESFLFVQNFAFAPTAGFASPVPLNYTFTLTNTANMTGQSSVIQNASCAGTISPSFTTCGLAPANVLDPLAAEIPVGARGGQNNFNPVGTGTQYASSDSVVLTAQLVDGVPSSVEQIAEVNLNALSGQASANAELQSTTNLTTNFTLGQTGGFTLNFLADVDMRTAILEALAGVYSSAANVNTTFTLTNTDTGGVIRWTPNGILNATDCTSSIVGATCVETADGSAGDTQDSLNANISTGANPSNVLYSDNNTFNPYGILVTGLPACVVQGTACYSLSLNSVTSTNVLRVVQAVPEPITLALVGVGLLGMGLLRRRSNNI